MMKLPLYRSIRDHYPEAPSTPNASLIFDRFVDWSDGWRADGPQKQKLFEEVARHSTNSSLLEAYLQRQSRQVEALGGVMLEAETSWRFVSGLGGTHPFETGFVWHRTLGVPCLPGSSVKGTVRAWTEQWEENEKAEIEYLFGHPNNAGAGALIFADALPTKPPRLVVDVMTPHYGEYYREGKAPGDYLSPIPVPFLAVAGGEGFRFSLLPRKKEDGQSLQRGANLLKDALETIGAGAKTSSGYGAFTVKAPKKDTRVEQMKTRIEAQNPNDIGSLPALVDELGNLPSGERRKELAKLLYEKFLSGEKTNKKRRGKRWFIKLQQMRENG